MARHDIRDYGALPDDDSFKAEEFNQAALSNALYAANATEGLDNREVYIPANMTFHMLPMEQSELYNITITIDGTLRLSKRHHVFANDATGHVTSMM